jgi:hypothetical protein
MRPLHALLPAVVALAFASAPASADSPIRLFDHPKGDLSAFTELQSTSGCIDRDTLLFPVVHYDGTKEADIEVTEYDHCADQVLSDHVSISGQPDLSITDDLTSASLQETIPTFDALDPAFPQIGTLTVDLVWQAGGPLYTDTILYDNGHSGAVTLVNHDHELCRDATLAGTLGGETVGNVVRARLCRQIGGSLFLFIEK